MKLLILLIAILLIIPQTVFAQETPEITEWTTEQRCITTPSQPPEGWAFGGVIFTFREGDGLHARRADVPTRYYVAFDDSSEFAGAGRISPDGRWFAVPAGRKELTQSTLLDYYFFIEEIRVYSTSPVREIFRIPIMRRDRTINSSSVTPVIWLDDQHLLALNSPQNYWEVRVPYLLAPFEGTAVPYEGVEPPSYREVYTSDDVERIKTVIGEGRLDAAFLSNDRMKLVYTQNAGTIHIADFETATITDTCIETPYSMSFSPDGDQVAFGLEPSGFIYILDLEAWAAYRIDLAANNVIGWYPLP